MALNCINLHQKGFGGRGAAPDPAGGLGSPLDPRPESMAMNILTTTSLPLRLNFSLAILLLTKTNLVYSITSRLTICTDSNGIELG